MGAEKVRTRVALIDPGTKQETDILEITVDVLIARPSGGGCPTT